ncbi:SPOR domain-containing protein [Mitsuaria sp. WAJ17]|uniref:SPOR domain-containing protein n=1 Tax=Mitsuaria sp. WAJ17 TaxID=2761452 RepID=UPI001600C30D|nr:SPOR domain-containing protein [Mitsuaria sp. WAJ17]MBB2485653.1 SPOR domain-containing protein [Mitsuaria sp. WAJ17]
MGLLSFFKRAEDNKTAAKPVAEGLDAVQQLRLRARRRLIGAAVLVAAGVIAFPLVFETQPRPVPVDLPIEIPKKDSLPPLNVPAATASATSAERHAAAPADQGSGIVNEGPPPVAEPAKPVEVPRTASHPEPRKEASSKPEPKAEAKLESRKVADKAPEKPLDKAQDKPHARPQPERDADAARAQALLEGREPPKPADRKADALAGARFIVQVGAFAEAKAAQDVRGKVEKLGLKTYTQAIETPDGKRIRVRVGPFASREEADRAAAKLRGGGLSGTVLTL